MSKHVTTKERDNMLEKLFKDAYKMDVKINVTTYNDENWNYDMVVMNFTDINGKKYGLIEYYRPGNDNSAEKVELEYERDGQLVREVFYDNKKPETPFFSAEKAMVELMKCRIEGKE